jgi:hypothetical protein
MAAMGVVGLMCFVSPFASTLPAPALPQLAQQFGITSSTVVALCVSVSVCKRGCACGSFSDDPYRYSSWPMLSDHWWCVASLQCPFHLSRFISRLVQLPSCMVARLCISASSSFSSPSMWDLRWQKRLPSSLCSVSLLV